MFINKDEKIFIAIYVDGLLLFEKNTSDLQKIQNKLKFRFRMIDFEKILHYLKMQINVENDLITFRQTTHLIKLLNKFNIIDCKSVNTLIKSDTPNNFTKYKKQTNQTTIK